MGGRGSLTELQERQRILGLFDEAIQSGARKSTACGILDISTRTISRWAENSDEDKRSSTKKEPANKMSVQEEEQIVSMCCSKRFRNTAPNEIVAILAEEGTYIASESTMYRVLRKQGLLKHRTESRPGTKSKKPGELKATGPNQVLSWDITYLKTIIKGQFYYLYLFEDIWSRLIAAWEVHSYESGDVASEIIKKLERKRCLEGVHLHSDNGSPMKSATMLATLQSLGVAPSFSRPQVSNDNPYSEALFRTLKYNAGYPKSFETIEEAREWVSKFVNWYNNEHRHSRIKYVTPMQRHTGEDKEILEKRKRTYEEAHMKNPNRWSRGIRNWDHIDTVYLNHAGVQSVLSEAA
jgi:transposase InsO family protein